MRRDIPKGFATKLGTVVAAIAAVCAAVTPVLDGDQTPEVITLLAVAGAAVFKVLDGRYKQATAQETANVNVDVDTTSKTGLR